MKIAIPLYDRFTALDAVGPFEVLAAAGVLDGLEATTHWLDLEALERLGARPASRRVVEQGKVITAAGVSSGIDMGLVLAARIAGPQVAQAIQLGIEYDPEPPFDSGSTAKAPPEIVELVRGVAAARACSGRPARARAGAGPSSPGGRSGRGARWTPLART